jgi:hypothetical protein
MTSESFFVRHLRTNINLTFRPQLDTSSDPASPPLAINGLNAVRIFLSVVNRNRDRPNLIIARRTRILTRRIFSLDERRRNLFSRRIPLFNQSIVEEILKKTHDIGLALVGFDLVFLQEGIADFAHAPRFMDELPDPCTHLVQAVIDTGL